MPPRIPIEIANAISRREAAWMRYDDMIELGASRAEKEAAYDAYKHAKKEVRFWYDLWQEVGGTSDIESILDALERKQCNIYIYGGVATFPDSLRLTRAPIEYSQARMAAERAREEYDLLLEAGASDAAKEAAYDAFKQAEKEVYFWYGLWQEVGGTSDIESILDALERKQYDRPVIIYGGEVLELFWKGGNSIVDIVDIDDIPF